MSNTLTITLRLLAATLGAYALAVASSLAMVPLFIKLLGSLVTDAVYAATMWSYVVFFAVFICAFSVSSLKRLYLGLLVSGVLCLAIHFAFVSELANSSSPNSSNTGSPNTGAPKTVSSNTENKAKPVQTPTKTIAPLTKPKATNTKATNTKTASATAGK
ncbi:hypothetical protein [Thalassotalea euphylliae]|uniref:DUF3649 domain-containing protein n=1 Tax=Thalassotalea euphylliae TaxID=1655234 RepID=A0A3E0UCF8_9GAMM|nr:hypothetical protein [Thalassotalea euphylliae]REL34678.1 hypothetical protein DXX92_04510 [Thalassotalea euphylliae]